MLFESLTTGAKLYIPFGGLKGNNTAEVPGYGGYRFENRPAYWTNEYQTNWLIDYKSTAEMTDGAMLSKSTWNMNGFLLVRGVRDYNK